MPTEAEWEYACRGGSATAFSFGNASTDLRKHAWFVANTHNIGKKHGSRVARKQPNLFGLYNMHGEAAT